MIVIPSPYLSTDTSPHNIALEARPVNTMQHMRAMLASVNEHLLSIILLRALLFRLLI